MEINHNVAPLRNDLVLLLRKNKLEKKFNKSIKLFQQNPYYPSLHTEKLEPKEFGLYSFRIDIK